MSQTKFTAIISFEGCLIHAAFRAFSSCLPGDPSIPLCFTTESVEWQKDYIEVGGGDTLLFPFFLRVPEGEMHLL